MKIILIEDVENLGIQGDTVEVKRGYARNFLIPQNLAWIATKGNLKRLEQKKKVWEVRLLREKDQSETLKSEIETKMLIFEARVGDEGQLYGSITTADIAEKLEAMGIIVDKRKVHLDEPIKRAGEHNASIRLHRDVEAVIKIGVKPEGADEVPKMKAPAPAEEAPVETAPVEKTPEPAEKAPVEAAPAEKTPEPAKEAPVEAAPVEEIEKTEEPESEQEEPTEASISPTDEEGAEEGSAPDDEESAEKP